MSGYAVQDPCVLVLDFALDAAMAEGQVFFGRRNGVAQIAGDGQNPVAAMPRGWKTSRRVQEARSSRISTSSAFPRRMKPGSEYSARVPGAA